MDVFNPQNLVVRVCSIEDSICPLCPRILDGYSGFAEACNHLYLHGLRCMHIGQETILQESGEVWQATVAIFGRDSWIECSKRFEHRGTADRREKYAPSSVREVLEKAESEEVS